MFKVHALGGNNRLGIQCLTSHFIQQEQVVVHSPIVDPDSFSDSDFVNPLSPELHCVLCKKVPRKPRRSKCCNTLYCEPCSKIQELCPAHKQKKEYTADSDLRSKV